MILPLPDWIAEMPNGWAKDCEKKRFYLKVIAVYATQAGSVKALARLLDVSDYVLANQATIDGPPISEEIRGKIYNLLGPDLTPPRLPTKLYWDEVKNPPEGKMSPTERELQRLYLLLSRHKTERQELQASAIETALNLTPIGADAD